MKGGNKAGFARVLARHHASVRPLLQFAISAESDVSSVSLQCRMSVSRLPSFAFSPISEQVVRRPDILFLKHASSIFRQSSNPVCGFSMMEQVILCAVCPMENWHGSSMNHIRKTV